MTKEKEKRNKKGATKPRRSLKAIIRQEQSQMGGKEGMDMMKNMMIMIIMRMSMMSMRLMTMSIMRMNMMRMRKRKRKCAKERKPRQQTESVLTTQIESRARKG